MVNLEGSSRTSKESLNALRFRNLTKKYLVDDDQVDAVKLKQLIHSASIVSERLAEANACSANDTQIRLQLDELRSELSKKCDALNEIGIAKARAESKNKFSASSSQTRASKPAQIISHDGLQGGQTDTDAAPGERIHNLLQQQKHISTQEIEEEKRAQAILMTELVDLTGILKNATIQMSSTVTEQNLQLDSIQHYASDNFDELSRQKKKMTEREKVMKRTFFSTIGSIFWVLFLFIFTYATIRLLPKPT